MAPKVRSLVKTFLFGVDEFRLADAAMKSPRLLILGINYAPEPTGIAVQTTGLAEALGNRGWDVSVVTGIPHYPAWKPTHAPRTEDRDSVHVIRRRHFVPPRQSVSLRAAYELSWLLSCLPGTLRDRGFDVVLGATPSLGGAVLAALAGARWRVPYVVMFHDLMGPALRQSRIRHAEWVAKPVASAELLCARHAAAVVVIGEGFRPYLVAGGVSSERVHVVRNPVRMPPPTRTALEVRKQLGWNADEFVVLHSGNMGAKQGLENVLRAAAQAREDERIRFVLQGDGNQRRHLEGLARQLPASNVRFAPLVPSEELPDVLAAADVLLLNQLREVRDMSLPSKLTSYFAAGRPVVAAASADSGAGREISASGAGILVEPDQPDALLEALRQLAAQPRLRDALGERGLAYARRELQPGATAERMNAVLTGLLPRHRLWTHHAWPGSNPAE